MSAITFTSKVITINSHTLVRIPQEISQEFPSRGMVLVKATIQDTTLPLVLEPDGQGSHWFMLDAKAGATLPITMEPSKDWPEPQVPDDIQQALKADQKAQQVWVKITPMARWDWIRWIRATKNPDTRKHRIEVACSKLRSGMRRPCCFNRSACTDPSVSNNGTLSA